MPEWQGKSRGNKLGYRIFVAVCKSIGLKPAYLLLRVVATYYFLFSRKTSRHIYEYFTKRHDYGKLKAIRNLYTNYYRFGQTLLDKIVIMSGIESNFTYHFDGEENLKEIASYSRGGILLSGHVGNWEVAGHFLDRLNITIHVVMFDGEHRQIKDYLAEVTGGRKFNVIVIQDDMSHIYAISEALQKNELICMHADRFMDKNKTRLHPFLGEPALFPAGPFVLASSFNVPVSIVFAFKETDSHYHFFGSTPIFREDGESKREFSDRLLRIFTSEMEDKLKLYPEQWFNYYNFWTK